MRHTRTGWWLEEAGEITPTPPLDGDTRADVVVVGGGYLGLWTAWQLRELEPALDVLVLEAAVCGRGPSGRNGGFCETLWGDAPTLREHAGDEAALAVCRASEDAVRGIGAWCRANAVDAWFREAPMLQVATTDSQVGSWDGIVAAAAALGVPDAVTALSADDVRARCTSPLFLGGALYRLNATVHPARLALGLRAKLLERGVRIHERTEVTRIGRDGSVETRAGRVRANAAVLAVNAAAASFPGYRLSLAVASSHMVLTEPIPDGLAELGWTGGEAIVDCRTLVHYITDDARRADRRSAGAVARWGSAGAPPIGSSWTATSSRADGAGSAPLLPADARQGRSARLGRPDRRLPHAPADLRQPRPRPPWLRLHRERRRPVLPRRRDPRAPRARPPRRENRARDRRALAETLPARAVPLRRAAR